MLDQLLGGAGPDGVTHQLATGLLGFTPESLLDEVVDAFAADDGQSVFGVVDKVIETGQDPRRFTEDLLRRLRDLVVVAAVPDAPATGLIDVSEDQGERLVAQAARFGRSELSRAADLVAAGLTEMRGATAPRMLLELICARVLLPGADHTADGVMARLDRLEKRAAITGTPGAPVAAAPAVASAAAPAPSARPEPAAESPAAPAPAPAGRPAEPAAAEPAAVEPAAVEPAAAPAPEPAAPPPTASEPASTPVPGPTGGLTLVDVRRLWPDIVEATKLRRRLTWIHLTQHAQVVAVDGDTLTLGFANAGARESFLKGGSVDIVRQAAIDVVGADWTIEAIVDPGAQAPTAESVEPGRAAPQAVAPAEDSSAPATDAAPAAPTGPPDWAAPEPDPAPDSGDAADAPADGSADAATDASTEAPPAPDASGAGPGAIDAARQAIRDTRRTDAPTEGDDGVAAADAEAHPDDLDVASLDGAELLQRTLGAEIIEEIPHQ